MTDEPATTTESAPSTLRILGIGAAAGLVPLNSTMIAVALPEIAEDFDVSIGEASVLITVYLVAMLVGQPLAGRLSDRVGDRRQVMWALVGFAVFSVAAAGAGTFGLLVAARGLQAVFGAALGPSVQSLLRSIAPQRDQGKTFGIMGSIIGVGAAAGPVIGGILVALFGWQAIFLINVPIAALAFYVLLRMGPVDTHADHHVPAADSTVVSGRIWNRVYAAAFSGQALTTFAQYSLLLLIPIILDARGWGSGSIGLVLSALTFGMIVFGPLGGRAGDRYGRRLPVTVGFSIATVAVAAIFVAGIEIETAILVITLGVFGIGLGGAIPSLTTAALQSVPSSRTGAAAGVLSMSRYVGSITTSVIIGATVSLDASGSATTLGLSVLAMLAAIGVAQLLPGRSA
jgi:MFS family permease